MNTYDDFLDNLYKNNIYSSINTIMFWLNSAYFFKQTIIFLIDNKTFHVNIREMFYLNFLKKKIKISKNIPKKIFPREYRLYKPFIYRAYKYGKKADLNFFKTATYNGLHGYKLKKGLNGKFFGWNIENVTISNSKKTTYNLETFSPKSLFEDWYVSITNKYNYSGYNRTIKVFPKNTYYSFFSSNRSMVLRHLMKKIWNQENYSYLYMLANLKKFRNFAKSFF